MIWQGAGVESLRLLADGLALGLHFLDILSCARLPRVHLPGERPVRTSHPGGFFVVACFLNLRVTANITGGDVLSIRYEFAVFRMNGRNSDRASLPRLESRNH